MTFETYPKTWIIAVLITFSVTLTAVSCKRSGGGGVFGPADDTQEAVKLVDAANEDLTKIKVLYDENEGKRQELKSAMEKNDAATAKKIADDVVYLINDGASSGNDAVDKIQKAQEMNINDDYREYLRLKEESLKLQLEAFEQYRMAARTLRDNYDPKNDVLREKVKEEFKSRSDNYRTLMEKARDYSSRANELYKAVLRKQTAAN